ncbi:MAG: daunorubicin biosynthesis sensory transduction protein DnrJ [Spirochaeta sp. LUC14_002_19_P3]|nr:MAG: daunorubicin biosynthesis sensory transduction protein DnrJ [Spirochaeta sp. LUC14_002_19_P3]
MIQVWSYLNELADEETEIKEAIDRVLHSGTLILGESVSSFEREFAAWCGLKHGVGVNSGTDALFLALKAYGIGAGDEVITVPNTAVPTVSAIVATGARPRFVDVNGETALMNTESLEAVRTGRTRAVLPVHLYGQCVDMKSVLNFAKKNELMVLEDCAQSHGAKQNGTMAGAFGHLAAFSFYPTKILGGYGDGGMVLANRAEDAEKLKRLRFYGMSGTYYSIEVGWNSRLDELHAAILRTKLTHLNAYVSRRRELARRYDEALAETGLGLPIEADGNYHAYYLYVVRHPERDRLMSYLKENGIHVNISYPWPIHVMPAYASLGYKEGDFPVAERLAKEIFSLPMYPSLRDEDQEMVIRTLKKALRH